MLPARLPKKPKRDSRWRTSAADGQFNDSVHPETLRELLSYDHEQGILTWKKRDLRFFQSERDWKIWNTKYANKRATSLLRGRRRVRVLGVSFSEHRVAWAIYHGEWPDLQIDHLNGDPSDNRLANLRLATNQMNSCNSKLPRNNKSGRIGVNLTKYGSWRAEICVHQKRIHLGCFDSFEAACAARVAAEREYGFHPNHGRAQHA